MTMDVLRVDSTILLKHQEIDFEKQLAHKDFSTPNPASWHNLCNSAQPLTRGLVTFDEQIVQVTANCGAVLGGIWTGEPETY